MSEDRYHYDQLVAEALRGVVRKVMGEAATHGLRGRHHFYITFQTDFPGVELPDHLRQRHPQEMTIVIQHQYWDLVVTDDAFSVVLSFNRVSEHLRIPFAAISGFADPSEQFMVPLHVYQQPSAADSKKTGGKNKVGKTEKTQAWTDGAVEAVKSPTVAKKSNSSLKKDEVGSDNVVTLDAFRKK